MHALHACSCCSYGRERDDRNEDTVKRNQMEFFESDGQRPGHVVAGDEQTVAVLAVLIATGSVQSPPAYDPQTGQAHVLRIVAQYQHIPGHLLYILHATNFTSLYWYPAIVGSLSTILPYCICIIIYNYSNIIVWNNNA